MASPGTPFNKARLKLAQAGINLSTADVRALLVSSAYVPNYDTHEFLSSVVAAELTTNGAARVALANKALAADDANDRAKFSCDPIEFGPAVGGTIPARRMITYVHTGNDATAVLLASYLLDDTAGGTDVVAQIGQKIKFTPNANGLLVV
jgi:hypothetical protein